MMARWLPAGRRCAAALRRRHAIFEIMRLRRNGRHDPHVLKAIFMAGGPGSGKSYVAQRLFGWGAHGSTSAQGLKRVDSDPIFERALRQAGIGAKQLGTMSEAQFKQITDGPGSLREHAKRQKKAQQATWSTGRLGLVLDGTGASVPKLAHQVEQLRALGYDCLMVFVNTPLGVALARNRMRDRQLPDALVRELWHRVQDNLGALQQLFGAENFVLIDGAAPRGADPAERRVRAFLHAGVQNRIGRAWLAAQAAPRVAANPAKRPDEAYALGWRIDFYKRISPSTKRPAIILHLRNASGVKVGQLFALRERPAAGPYTMVSVDAPHGWGPLLYDVAMELSGAAGLTPDRTSISKAAIRIWAKYAERADVAAHPLPPWMSRRWGDPVLDAYYTKRSAAVPALRAARALRTCKGDPPRE